MNIGRWLIVFFGITLGMARVSESQAEPLPVDQAFRLSAQAEGADAARFVWDIAEGYYLYRKKFRFAVKSGNVDLGAPVFPSGLTKNDPIFGAMEIYRNRLEVQVPVQPAVAAASLEVTYQGCFDEGVCYPPVRKTVELHWPAGAGTTSAQPSTAPVAEQDQIAAMLKNGSLGWTMLSFLGFGLLLAFTPCMFPMIPILSGIIAGQGRSITTSKAFFLSLTYVLATSFTYTVLGLLAGLFGSNLQAALQAPPVLVGFSLVFVALSLSMFGFYELQMPAALQSRLYEWSGRQQGGRWLGTAVMGALSALIMGPCVAAPLAGALIYIGQTGDAWLGGIALFSLGLGMGIPLLAIGTSAGNLLPRAGRWMEAVKKIFGVAMLGVAIRLLERMLPEAASLFLWAALLIVSSIYLGALDTLSAADSGWRRLWKGVGVIFLVYGTLLLVGVAAGGRDPIQPLWGLAVAGDKGNQPGLAFEKVASTAELGRRIEQARAEGRWVMLDFYADWCVSCKEMERETFADPSVRAALQNAVLIQADVTANSDGDRGLLQRFGLVGPPATLFFDPQGRERENFRVVGYQQAERFRRHLGQVFAEGA